MLLYRDVEEIALSTKGVKGNSIEFHQVFLDSKLKTNKGLYVNLGLDEDNSDQLMKEALYNGAIGAIWPQDEELPYFLPNHFPVFFVENPADTLKLLLTTYLKKLEEKRDCTMTKFILTIQENHIAHNTTYYESVREILENLKTELATFEKLERRG